VRTAMVAQKSVEMKAVAAPQVRKARVVTVAVMLKTTRRWMSRTSVVTCKRTERLSVRLQTAVLVRDIYLRVVFNIVATITSLISRQWACTSQTAVLTVV